MKLTLFPAGSTSAIGLSISAIAPRYYFHIDDSVAFYGYGRWRFGNLDPSDNSAFKGMEQRKGEFEAGIGATLITPYALLSARISSDVTGRSNGQELLLWADFPVIKDNLLIMPGDGADDPQ